MEAGENMNQQLDELLIKYLVGSASDDERDLALIWINESSEHQKYFDELKVYYQLTKVVQKPSGFNREEGWNRVKGGYYKARYLSELEDKKKRQKKVLINFIMSAAAVMILAFILGNFTKNFLHFNDNQSEKLVYNEIRVPLGAKSLITLSDGTKVWLNAGSKLRYPMNFSAKIREVYLEGEAYFDVTKMEKKLFIVKTSDVNIKVYGTQFNVKSYPNENQIQTTLVKGSVIVEPIRDNSKESPIILKPNQTVTYYKSLPIKPSSEKEKTLTEITTKAEAVSKIIVIPKVDPLPITSWKDSLWIIVGEDLSQLAVKLERRYNVKISFENESLKKYKFSGTLKEETFEQVLKIIQLSAPIQYSIENNKVVFAEDPLYKKKYDKMILKTD